MGDVITATVPPPADTAAITSVLAAVHGIETAVTAALEAIRDVDPRQVAREEGMALETALRCFSGAGGMDVATLLAAADLLDRMPALDAAVRDGMLSWADLRLLTVAARRMRRGQLDALDAWIAEHGGRLARLDVELRTEALDRVLRDLTDVRTIDRQAEQLEAVDRFVLQLQTDGASESYGTWSPESTAVLADALQAEADAPQATPCPSGRAGDHTGNDRAPVSRGRQQAAALLRLLVRGRAGADAPTPPARLTMLVDVDRLTDQTAATLQTALRGRPPRIVRRTLDRLSCDATIDTVIRNGTDLLAAHRNGPEITAATRRAVAARDGGCRWPTCTAPIAWCDIHHVVARAAGGDHHPTNLVLLCRRHHTTVHHRGWRQTTDPDGTYTLHRRGRTLTSHPRNVGLPPPHQPGRAPPRHPVDPPTRGRSPDADPNDPF